MLGLVVGTAVGAVGLYVGYGVGDLLGLVVGEAVGTLLGLVVGAAVGVHPVTTGTLCGQEEH